MQALHIAVLVESFPWLQASKTPAIFRFCSHFKNVQAHSLQWGFAGVSQWNITSLWMTLSLLSLSCICSAGLMAIVSGKKLSLE